MEDKRAKSAIRNYLVSASGLVIFGLSSFLGVAYIDYQALENNKDRQVSNEIDSLEAKFLFYGISSILTAIGLTMRAGDLENKLKNR